MSDDGWYDDFGRWPGTFYPDERDDVTEQLADWLLVQLAADEQVARAATPGPWWHTAEADQVRSTRGPDETTLLDEDIVVADGYALSNQQLRANVTHIALWDPARVLADIDAKRQLIQSHRSYETDWSNRDGRNRACSTCGYPDGVHDAPWPCLTLRLLALPYADRPGYQDAWRP